MKSSQNNAFHILGQILFSDFIFTVTTKHMLENVYIDIFLFLECAIKSNNNIHTQSQF